MIFVVSEFEKKKTETPEYTRVLPHFQSSQLLESKHNKFYSVASSIVGKYSSKYELTQAIRHPHKKLTKSKKFENENNFRITVEK